MENIFDDLINSFIENKVGTADKFISDSLALALTENLQNLFTDNKLLAAGMGNNAKHNVDNLFRGDKIYWLDASHKNTAEDQFFVLMDAFVKYLNESCYTGITGYEFHYTLYAAGTFYKKHLDRFQDNDSRKYSMIMYLNLDWQLADGGQLCIQHPEGAQNIDPTNGKVVFFNSKEMEHEVLLTNKPRMSITGWLKG